MNQINELLDSQEIHIINLGLEIFSQTLESLDVNIININWRPPAEGDSELTDMLVALSGE